MLLQFLNCKQQHSVRTAFLLAIFEGDKDNYYKYIQVVFGPVMQVTQNVLANLLELNLKVDLPKCASTCTKANENFLKSKGCKIGQWSFGSLCEIPRVTIAGKTVSIARN